MLLYAKATTNTLLLLLIDDINALIEKKYYVFYKNSSCHIKCKCLFEKYFMDDNNS